LTGVRLHWGGVRTHEARTVRLPRSICEESWAPTWPAARVILRRWYSPHRWVARCARTWIKRFFKPAVRVAGLPELIVQAPV
jgi:hypothetical protein